MKKIISLLLVAMMCVSLCACGGSESTSGDGQQNQVQNEQNNEENKSTEKEKQTIEITMDNWEDYFEIKESYFAVFSSQNPNELTAVNIDYYFLLKEEYIGKVDLENSEVVAEMVLDVCTHGMVFSEDGLSYELKDECNIMMENYSLSSKAFLKGDVSETVGFWNAQYSHKFNETTKYPGKIEFVNVSGTLVLE